MWSAQRIFLGAISVSIASILYAPSAFAEGNATDCSSRKDVLGVSRVVEVDASDGLRFGRMQYKDFSFLKEGEVVLTFDDGPSRRHTTSVLNALEAECTKAMFFMVGRMAVSDPSTVREIDRRGHTIATHTWSHPNLKARSKERAKKEIELGISAISVALGKPPAPFFRFPYLADPKSMISYLKSRDIAIFSIDVDSKDFRTRSGSVMVSRTLKGLKRNGKGILLFHDIQTSTAKGIKALLRKLKKNGFKVVHVVSKAPVKTLPKYDTIALKELNRRKKSWEKRPFPKTAIKWPVSQGGLPAPVPLAFLTPPAKVENQHSAQKENAAGSGDYLPNRNPLVTGTGLDTQTKKKFKHKRSSVGAIQGEKPVVKKRALRFKPSLDPLQQRIYSD